MKNESGIKVISNKLKPNTNINYVPQSLGGETYETNSKRIYNNFALLAANPDYWAVQVQLLSSDAAKLS